jgi:DNA topoisomerase-1
MSMESLKKILPEIAVDNLVIETDSVETAAMAGLVYICDWEPGITRKETGPGFEYYNPDGSRIADEKELQRIRSLVIPPAWTEVWISPLPDGHLQATGRDASGRKQYRYHSEWGAIRGQTKFNRMVTFGLALPAIRKRTEADLKLRGFEKKG